MSQPYFDHRSLLALGIPKHTVDALQETFTRTGGAGDVALTLTDLEVLVTTALDQGRIAQRLRDRVNQLEAEISSIPTYTRQITELRGRMADIENQLLSIPNIRLNQLQAQINDLSIRLDDVPRVNLSDIYRRLEVLEAL